MTFLSIIMPVFNEGRTVCQAIDEVLAVEYPCPTELIVIDDGSSDSTRELLLPYQERGVRLLFHDVNRGKGAAVRTGVDEAEGTHLIIVDADLEYAPRDIAAMLVPVIEGRANHVFGSRIFGLHTRFHSFRFAVGGRLTTLAANMLYDSCLTDMHTCLKLVPVSDFRDLSLGEDGFGLDTQLTARLLRAGIRPFEVPISYHGRSFADGKKLTMMDGVRCLGILAKVRLSAKPALNGADAEVRLAVAAAPQPERSSERPFMVVGSGTEDNTFDAEIPSELTVGLTAEFPAGLAANDDRKAESAAEPVALRR